MTTPAATVTTPPVRTRRPTVTARRWGYAVGAIVNLALLYAVNIWPGWEVLPFLTAETVTVLVIVNLSIIGNLVADAGYLVYDAPWFKSLGTLITTAIAMIAMVRIWQVFPFDFSGSAVNWELVTRIFLIIGIVGSDIGIVAACVTFMKSLTAPQRQEDTSSQTRRGL